ncbi:hypothetical protein ACFPM7_21920 [Actinokineospora guangxiensis]|uniref:Uncharacterized protein n=1 Tax=Actinokineospora guangxiensis TaxID=1490288 RepID=A0ABW0EQN1_9PSEU
MIEDQLKALFAARAADAPDTPDLADAVIRRATAIRRRRTVLAAAACTVLVAAVALLAISPGPRSATEEFPVATPRPATVAFGERDVLLADGTRRQVSGERLSAVQSVAGGWVTTTATAVSYVPVAGPPVVLGPGEATVAVNRAGTRVAVQPWGEATEIRVFAFPGAAALGSSPASAQVVNRWAGEQLLVTTPNGDAGAVPYAYWTAGATAALRGEMLTLGSTDQAVIGLVPADGRACVVRVDLALAETARACGTGFSFADGVPLLTPDGRFLIGPAEGRQVRLDLAKAFAGEIDREEVTPREDYRLVWDSPSSAIYRSTGSQALARCDVVGGGGCSPYAVPEVGSAPARGLVPKYPDLDAGAATAVEP